MSFASLWPKWIWAVGLWLLNIDFIFFDTTAPPIVKRRSGFILSNNIDLFSFSSIGAISWSIFPKKEGLFRFEVVSFKITILVQFDSSFITFSLNIPLFAQPTRIIIFLYSLTKGLVKTLRSSFFKAGFISFWILKEGCFTKSDKGSSRGRLICTGFEKYKVFVNRFEMIFSFFNELLKAQSF